MRPLIAGDPEKIGPFALRGRLGAGGMGTVFLGRSPAGRAVAVKVVHPHLAHQAEFRRRFGQEATAAAAVSGAYTAPVVGAGPDDDPPWLATLYIPGPSLAEALAAGGALPEASVWALAAGLVEALGAVHAAGLVHRDLKPSNVLLAGDGPRVIDFGIARALEATGLTQSGTVIGTPGFMSPEQVEGGEVGPLSDVFTLGCVLAYAAIGTEPFGTGPPLAVLHRITSREPHLEGMLDPLRDMAAACLTKDPDHRPTLAHLGEQIASHWAPPEDVEATSLWPDAVATLIHTRTTPTLHLTPTTGLNDSTPPHPEQAPLEDLVRRYDQAKQSADPAQAARFLAEVPADQTNGLGRLLAERGENEDAEILYRRAAEGGHTAAMFSLGYLLEERGEKAQAESWYRRIIAETGDTDAMLHLSLLLEQRGEDHEAEFWYRRAAEDGNASAMFSLGYLLEERGEEAEAESWYRRAAEGDYALAMSFLGLLLEERGEKAEAEIWYRRDIAETDSTDAMFKLGRLLEGRGEDTEAESWYRRAAEGDYALAMSFLGLLLEERGEKAEAESWYRRAAEHGNASAMYNLAVLLAKRGEKAEAESWYRRAAEHGHTRAMNNLADLLKRRGEKDEAKAWRSRARSAGGGPDSAIGPLRTPSSRGGHERSSP